MNPMKRSISKRSPTWIPLLINLILLLIGGMIYLYTVTDMPSTYEITKMATPRQR
jgi:hypothetical protein